MGFLGGVFKSIGKVASGIVKFAKSPFGQLLINVGLSLVTGGAGGLLAKGLGMLGNMGKLGSMVSSFGGFASKFLGPVESFISKSGLGGIAGFLQNSGSTGDLLKMAGDIFTSRKDQPETDTDTQQVVQQNLMQLFAKRHAEMLQQAA
jgi:hypothetical protein